MDDYLIVILIILSILLLIVLLSNLIALMIKKSILGHRYDDNGTLHYFAVNEFENLKCEEKSFISDNILLQGYLYQHIKKENKALVILAHGLGVGQKQYMCEINWLCENGFMVFSYDVRGCANSQGKAIGNFKNAIRDLESAIKFVKTLNKNLPILLYGHSMGGYSVNNVLPFVQNEIKGAVSLSSPNSFNDLLKGILPSMMGKIGYFLAWIASKQECLSGKKYQGVTSLSSLKKIDLPVLLIVGDKDDVVPLKRHHNQYVDKLKDKKNISFYLVKDRYHRPNLTISAAEYAQEVNNKINQYGKKYPKGIPEIEKRKLYDSFDYQKLVEMDNEVLQKILEFYNNCL